MAQKAVNTRRRDFQPVVIHAINLQRKLKLARDLFAVFHCHELLGQLRRTFLRRLPRQINRDAQQAAGRALDFNQVIAQTCDGLFNDLL